jgi:hypothetical protein
LPSDRPVVHGRGTGPMHDLHTLLAFVINR